MAGEMPEQDQQLQELVLTLHHACIHTLGSTGAFKIIENHQGVAFIQMVPSVILQGAQQQHEGAEIAQPVFGPAAPPTEPQAPAAQPRSRRGKMQAAKRTRNRPN